MCLGWERDSGLTEQRLDVFCCCGSARVREEDGGVGVGVASGAGVVTCTLLFHGMVGRGRVFGRDGCTMALYRDKLATGCHGLGGSLKGRE